jgi:mono/diheme cytochrome c family protein
MAAACTLAADPAPPADPRLAGQQLYARHCLSCHQADGGGVPKMQPPIVGRLVGKGVTRVRWRCS